MLKVSIIIPIYNAEKYIARCLESVLNQTYKNIEIVCVDDCGTDKSLEIVEQYQKKFGNKVIIIKTLVNQGSGAARDLGIEKATGEYLTFLDSDDYIKKDCIQKYMEVIEQENAEVVIGGFIRKKNGKENTIIPKNEQDMWLFSSSCHKLYKTSFLRSEGINFRGTRRYEDEPFSYRILLAKSKLALIDYAGYYYAYNNDSMTQSRKSDRSDIFFEYVDLILAFYKEVIEFVPDCNLEIFKYCIFSKMTACFLYNARGCGSKKMNILYKKYNRTLLFLFGETIKNKYLTFFKILPSEDAKTHYSTWLVACFRRIKIDKILFLIDSKL